MSGNVVPDLNVPKKPRLDKTGKRAKGENLRIIQAFMKSIDKGMTAVEISKGTQIGLTSVMAVVKRHDDIFVRANDGLWRLKKHEVNTKSAA